MEVSAMPPMPLDFSMVRSGSGSPGMREGSPRPVSNSAFRVVTPKGMFSLSMLDFWPSNIIVLTLFVIQKLLLRIKNIQLIGTDNKVPVLRNDVAKAEIYLKAFF